MGLGFKKWNKMPQAKFWLEKSKSLSDGKFSKATNQLVGLEKIEPIAGIGAQHSPEKKPPMGDQSAFAAIDVTSKQPKNETAKELGKTNSAPMSNEDLGFLEEESFSSTSKSKDPKANSTSKAFDSMIQDIDNITEFSDEFTFDDNL
jgi:hypothetical protein